MNKENNKNFFLKKYRMFFLLTVLILLQCLYMLGIFATKKNGFHSDEIYGYGVANRNTGSYQVQNQINPGQWISGDILRNCITVQKGERFSYASVYRNNMYDQNPPFYYMLLHTICSFFPESFSLWYGFVINILMFILLQVCLFLLSERIFNNSAAALIVCAFYGFSKAALGTVVYLRMYAVLTALTLLYLVILQKMYQKNFRKITKEMIAMVICMMLGEFTQYFFYLPAFFMTAFLCLYLLLKREYKSLLIYGAASLLGAGLCIAAIPSVLSVITDKTALYTYAINLPFWHDLEYCLNFLSQNTLGVDWLIDRFVLATWLLYIILAGLFAALLFLLFRKDAWFAKIKEPVLRNAAYLKKNGKEMLKNRIQRINWFFVCAALSVFAALTLISRIINVWDMFSWCDRYLFFLMPFFILEVFYGMYLFLCFVLRKIPAKISRSDAAGQKEKQKQSYKKSACIVLAVLAAAAFIIKGDIGQSHYLFEDYAAKDLTDITRAADCIVVTDSDWSVQWFCAALSQAENVYIINAADMEDMLQNINARRTGEAPLYFIAVENAFAAEEGVASGKNMAAWMPADSADITKNDFIKRLLQSCQCAETAELLFERPYVSGYLSVYALR